MGGVRLAVKAELTVRSRTIVVYRCCGREREEQLGGLV